MGDEMPDGTLRSFLGVMALVVSAVVFYQYTIWWGIGTFVVLNLVLAPILSYFEKKNN